MFAFALNTLLSDMAMLCNDKTKAMIIEAQKSLLEKCLVQIEEQAKNPPNPGILMLLCFKEFSVKLCVFVQLGFAAIWCQLQWAFVDPSAGLDLRMKL